MNVQHETMLRKPILMPPSMIKKVDRIAKRKKVSFAEVVREAVEAFGENTTAEDEHILDALVEGFDEEASKKQLIEAFAGRDLPIVSASGIAGREIAPIRVHRLGNCTVVGDFVNDFREDILYCPKITIIAAMMADIVLQKVLL